MATNKPATNPEVTHGEGCLCLRCRQAWGKRQMDMYAARNAVIEAAKAFCAGVSAPGHPLADAVAKLEALDFATKEPK